MASPLASVVRDLERLTIALTTHEIVQAGVDIAQHATGSRIAYLHFLNEDQSTIELGVWSHDTLAACTAVHDRHYPVADAGIWADTARYRRPCIHNDYEQVPGRHGLPGGHSRLLRHLGLPVIEADRVRMLVGVGNKESDYDQDDIDMLDMVARRIWSVASQRRVLEHYLDIDARHRLMQRVVSVCGLEYDVDEDVLVCDGMFARVFSMAEQDLPSNQREFLELIEQGDRARVAQALISECPDVRTVRLAAVRPDGTTFPAEMGLEFRTRDLGEGLIANGTIRDLTGEVAAESLRKRADTDPLTGLPNRNVLTRLGESANDRRRASPGVAFHYIDLDRFKPVNDTYGHMLGDEVLRIVAERLRASTRQGDTVIRMGGDEFAVVQVGVDDPASALMLADAIVDALGQPMVAHGRSVRVGASVGIALSVDGTSSLRELSESADRALYRAKALGGNRSLIAGAWETSP